MNGNVGISGFAAYLPRFRVNLEDWCTWTGNNVAKISSVVGDSFRMCGNDENIYTMAANAVLRLIRSHDIDPANVGMLALGTESSTDNSAGAVIVRGMVDDALLAQGLPALARHCEVPEFKHACLGGVYAMKAALRYLSADGAGNDAIVVSADIAEYARSSSGEPTQGAGAVAMQLNAQPRLLTVNLKECASASAYRGPDFRKPFARFRCQRGARIKDFPVFNGKYSTTCYVDATLAAMRAAVTRHRCLDDPAEDAAQRYLAAQAAVFMHRPYQRMPETGWTVIVLYLLSVGGAQDLALLDEICSLAGVERDSLIAELHGQPELYQLVRDGNLDAEVFPLAQSVVRAFRQSNLYASLVDAKLAAGKELMRHVGNLYSAALPAWLAAGMEDCARRGVELAGQPLLAIGYGSGDAAEIMPMRAVPGWQERALRTAFAESLSQPTDLSQQQYERLHDYGSCEGMSASAGFGVNRVGAAERGFDDSGIEYYRYSPID